MNKIFLLIGLVCTFLILGSTTTLGFVYHSKINTVETGQIICHVRDKDAPPEPELKGLKNIKLVLKNDEQTITLEGVTDDNGQYIFKNLTYGIYSITAYGNFGYSNQTINGIILRESTVYIEFKLTKKSRSRNCLNSVFLEIFQHYQIFGIFYNYFN